MCLFASANSSVLVAPNHFSTPAPGGFSGVANGKRDKRATEGRVVQSGVNEKSEVKDEKGAQNGTEKASRKSRRRDCDRCSEVRINFAYTLLHLHLVGLSLLTRSAGPSRKAPPIPMSTETQRHRSDPRVDVSGDRSWFSGGLLCVGNQLH